MAGILLDQQPLLLETLQDEVRGLAQTNDYLVESIAELELALDEQGWNRLENDGNKDFSRGGIDRIVALARLAALKNPLIRRGVHLKSHYVWGQGVEVSADDEQVNQVVQDFMDDRSNRDVLFSAQARQMKDRTLTTDGNVVFVLVPNLITGQVKVRCIPIDEIRDRVCNPEDRAEVWFYHRVWSERTWNLDGPSAGINRIVRREAWYPDWRHTPPANQRHESIGGAIVRWDTPIMHVSVGGLDTMTFGVPEVYAALDWAKAYKLFLEDWATIVRSLSRFAWNLTVKRKPADAAAKLGSTLRPSQRETNPAPVAGATFAGTADASLTPIAKTGATVAAEDGVWLAKMVGAALDLPYTILMGDPDMGNLATAKTLDRPTELAMNSRQDLWADVYRDLCNYAVDWALRAPGGPLSNGLVQVVDGMEQVVLTDESDRTVGVTFPPILEQPLKETIDAIVAAHGTELAPPKTILTLLLQALGVEDVDEIVDGFDEEYAARQANVGDLATKAFRQGQDPAALLR